MRITKDPVYPRRDALLLLPFLVGFAMFYVLPLFISPYYALTRSAFNAQFAGLDNFKTILNNPFYRLAYGNTFRFTLIAAPLSVLLAVLLGFALRKSSMPSVWMAAFVLPILLPTSSVCAVMRQVFSSGFLFTFAPYSPEQYQVERLSLYAFYLWKYTGVSLLIFYGALSNFPRDILEAAALDNAGPLRCAVQVVLPCLTPQLIFMLTYACANSFQIFREAYLLYGSYPNDSVYQLQHYMNNHFLKLNYQYVTSGGILFTVPVVLLVALGLLFTRRQEAELS